MRGGHGARDDQGVDSISAEQHLRARQLARRVLAASPLKTGRRGEKADGKAPHRAK